MDRVLEIGGHAAGYCGRLFVQNGHEVVRVEREPQPAWVSGASMDLFLHAGKERVSAVDATTIRQLANEADVVIFEGASADEVAASGFDEWQTPVKVALTPFGRSGPKRNWRATPNVLLAMGGYTNIMGDPGRAPLTLSGHYTEFQAGQFAYVAAGACRLAGEVNSIDIGMFECLMALSQFTTVQWHCANRIRSRHGSDFWWVVPTNLFRCKDGWCYLNIVPTFWDPMATFLEKPELVIDPRFATNADRMENRDALHSVIDEVLSGLTRQQVLARANHTRIPLGVVQTLPEVLADEHLQAREFWQRVDDGATTWQSPSLAYRFDHEARASFTLQPVVADAGFHAARAASTHRDERKDRSTGASKSLRRGPLHGIRILDLTHVWAGPLATRILSDLGAEIVKVERATGRGPRTATVAPIGGWMGGEPGEEPWNANAVFVKLARNSRSVCLDLKHARGRALFLELVKVADVVIENFSARAMPAMGLDYATLAKANPNIIYVTSAGFGAYGPYRDWVAFGPSVEPMTGLTSVMGYSADEPRNTAMALIDPIAATSAATAVISAVRRRDASGTGAYVEMSLFESGVSFNGPWLIESQRGAQIEPCGNRHPNMAPHGVYRCAGVDEWVALGCPDQAAWEGLCVLLGRFDPRLELAERRARQDEIDAAIGAWTSARTRQAAADELQARNVPAGPVNTAPDMTADAQSQARGFFVTYERFHTPMPGNPIKMDGISPRDWTPCPKLGEHNRQVLGEWLGYTDEQVDDLVRDGLLADKPPA